MHLYKKNHKNQVFAPTTNGERNLCLQNVKLSYKLDEHMAGVAQLVRAPVCGTGCRRFESGRPPHKNMSMGHFFMGMRNRDENRPVRLRSYREQASAPFEIYAVERAPPHVNAVGMSIRSPAPSLNENHPLAFFYIDTS